MDLLSKANKLHDQGVSVIPTGENKRSLNTGWQNMHGDNRVVPNGNFKTPSVHGVGVLTGVEVDGGYLLAIDVDSYDKELSRNTYNFICELVDAHPAYRVGEAPKFLIPVICDENTRKLASAAFTHEGKTSRLEVLGQGQQFVAYGAHKHGIKGVYTWHNGEFDIESLPRVTIGDILMIRAQFEAFAHQLEMDQITSATTIVEQDPFAGVITSDVSIAEAEEIVSYIDPDCDYDTWFRVGAALHHEFEGSDDAFDLWYDWSNKGDKATENKGANDPRIKWDSFETDGNAVGFRSVCEYARQAGADLSAISRKHKSDSIDTLVIEDETPISRFKLVDDLLEAQPEQPKWLIKHILERDSLAMVYGASGAGKSYFVILMAVAIAMGKKFHKHDTKPGTVVYMCGEGYRGVLARLRAIRINDNISRIGNLYLTNRITDFSSADDIKATVRELKDANISPDLIISDTLARASGGFDENSTADMNKFVKACDYMRKTFGGCTVMPVHHTGKGDKGVARGSSVLRAAMDVEIMVESVEGGLVVSSTKAKDGEPFAEMGFSFKRVNFGVTDEDGEELYSHVIQQSDDVLEKNDKNNKLTPSGEAVVKAFDEMWQTEEARVDAPEKFIHQFGMDAPTEGFWESDVRDHFKAAHPGTEEAKRKAWNRGLKDAMAKDCLAIWDDILVKL